MALALLLDSSVYWRSLPGMEVARLRLLVSGLVIIGETAQTIPHGGYGPSSWG
jgi:hypothetical protein